MSKLVVVRDDGPPHIVVNGKTIVLNEEEAALIEETAEPVNITVVAENCEHVEGLRVLPGQKLNANVTVTAERVKSVTGVRFG